MTKQSSDTIPATDRPAFEIEITEEMVEAAMPAFREASWNDGTGVGLGDIREALPRALEAALRAMPGR